MKDYLVKKQKNKRKKAKKFKMIVVSEFRINEQMFSFYKNIQKPNG